MQKVINALAVASFLVSGAIVGLGGYVYVNRDSIVSGVKDKVTEEVKAMIPDLLFENAGIPSVDLPISGEGGLPEMDSLAPSGIPGL